SGAAQRRGEHCGRAAPPGIRVGGARPARSSIRWGWRKVRRGCPRRPHPPAPGSSARPRSGRGRTRTPLRSARSATFGPAPLSRHPRPAAARPDRPTRGPVSFWALGPRSNPAPAPPAGPGEGPSALPAPVQSHRPEEFRMTTAPTGTGRGPAPQAVPEPRAKALAARAGVPVPRGAACGSAAGAARAAAGLRPPLVLKAHGPGLVHKSDAGAVRLGLAGPDEVAAAAAEMGRALAEAGCAAEGFLVEEQAEAGVELIVGVLADPSFGPVLMVGLGGVWTEVLDDAAVLPCPVHRGEVEATLAGLRGAALLDGARGTAPVYRPALLDLVMAVGGPGGLAERLGPRLAEFELNPVIAGPRGAVAVDARLLLREGAGESGALPAPPRRSGAARRSEEHTSELQSRENLL